LTGTHLEAPDPAVDIPARNGSLAAAGGITTYAPGGAFAIGAEQPSTTPQG
jgi:hypothetical protein